jgi:LacI family transcriptional regulator
MSLARWKGRDRVGVSMHDVAALAGVSTATVSNTLNHPEKVSPAQQRKVREAMETLGYVRNESARRLKSGRSQEIGLIVPRIESFFEDIAKAADEVADEAGAAITLCSSFGVAEREARHLRRLMQQPVQGILLDSVDRDGVSTAPLPSPGIPVVFIAQTVSPTHHCSVSANDVEGGRLAGRHLVDLGHRSLAFVGELYHERLLGFRDEVGMLAPNTSITVFPGQGDAMAAGQREAGAIAAMPASQRPTAVFCGSDLIAIGVLQALMARGIAVPGDISIVGYDDIDFAAVAAVPLTTIRQPRAEIGKRAVRLLLDEVAEGVGHRHSAVVFEPELIVRGSSAPPSPVPHPASAPR